MKSTARSAGTHPAVPDSREVKDAMRGHAKPDTVFDSAPHYGVRSAAAGASPSPSDAQTNLAESAQARTGRAAAGPSRALTRRARATRPPGGSWRVWRTALQASLAATFLVCWQFLPTIHFLAHHFRVLDPFYVSSPTQVWDKLRYLITGDPQTGTTMWPYLWTTVSSTVEGTVIGLLLGALAGLIFSNNERLGEIIRPFIILANSVPRVAIIPISVVLFGPTPRASVFNVITVVFFVGFFNASRAAAASNQRFSTMPRCSERAHSVSCAQSGCQWF